METRFIWDQAAALPQVVATSGGQTAQYLYGRELSGVQQGGQGYSPLADALGSLRQWTDAAGAEVGSASYDPFGGVLSQQGFTSPWGFAGEYHDPTTGLQYLRARWYQPGVGRFTQRDPFPGVLALPLTLNPYVYGLNHPTRYTDPSGENPWLIAGGAVLGGIAGGVTYFATLNHSIQPFNGRDLGIAVGMGLVSGGFMVMGLMGSPMALAAALTGLTSTATQVFADHGCFNWPAIAGMYVNGAIAGALASMAGWKYATHYAVGGLVGGGTSLAGDIGGRITTQLLLSLTGEADWNSLNKPFMYYLATFGLGVGAGFLAVSINKTLLRYFGKAIGPLQKESATCIECGRQEIAVAMELYQRGGEPRIMEPIALRGIVMQKTGRILGTMAQNILNPLQKGSLVATGILNSNVFFNFLIGTNLAVVP